MNPGQLFRQQLNRRHFFGRMSTGIGTAALASLLDPCSLSGSQPHHAPRAKNVIYLFQSGGPSQLDLFDCKPDLRKYHGTELPDSIRQGQRLTGMTSGQKSFPVAASSFKFARHGAGGTWFSDAVPHLAKIADDLCVVNSLHTEAINHDPAITFLQTGSQFPGRPSIGSWVSYGLGSENSSLPAFVVFTSIGTGRPDDQPLYARLWGSGFLPSSEQGVQFRADANPVLYLHDPPGLSRTARREMLDSLSALNSSRQEVVGDAEIQTRIDQYELAFRMQNAVPELMNVSGESKAVIDAYGPDVHKPGTFAANCLLARRLVERGVRFVQLFHRGWDQHRNLPAGVRGQCRDTDQASAALIADLKQRGLLEETLVVWGGEFGRTVYCQEELKPDNYGRDHHPKCFSVFLAGGGVKGGMNYGLTDDYGYNVVDQPVHVHDLHATILHCLGIDHEKLTYKFQGRHYRLTDVHGRVVPEILS